MNRQKAGKKEPVRGKPIFLPAPVWLLPAPAGAATKQNDDLNYLYYSPGSTEKQ